MPSLSKTFWFETVMNLSHDVTHPEAGTQSVNAGYVASYLIWWYLGKKILVAKPSAPEAELGNIPVN
jgi:hypothetical protein